MSDNVIIPIDNPVVVPTKEGSTYDRQWIKNFRIVSNEAGKAMIATNLVPYNGTDILEGPIESVVIQDVFATMSDKEVSAEVRTALGNAMETILVGINAYKAYEKAKKDIDEPILGDE